MIFRLFFYYFYKYFMKYKLKNVILNFENISVANCALISHLQIKQEILQSLEAVFWFLWFHAGIPKQFLHILGKRDPLFLNLMMLILHLGTYLLVCEKCIMHFSNLVRDNNLNIKTGISSSNFIKICWICHSLSGSCALGKFFSD